MNEQRVRDYWSHVWSEGDVDFVHRFYKPQFVLNGREQTPEAFAAGAARFLEHFDDFRATVDRAFECGDVVVTRALFTGVHVQAFPGVPATGAAIEISGLDVFRFEDGAVVEHLHEADHEAMWEQLGLRLPPG